MNNSTISASARGPLTPFNEKGLPKDEKPHAEVRLTFLPADAKSQVDLPEAAKFQARLSIVLEGFTAGQVVGIFDEQSLSIPIPIDPENDPRHPSYVTPEEMALIRRDVINQLMANSRAARMAGSGFGTVPISEHIEADTSSCNQGDFHALVARGSEGVQREEKAILTSEAAAPLNVVIGLVRCLHPPLQAIAGEALARLHPDLSVQTGWTPEIVKDLVEKYDQLTLPSWYLCDPLQKSHPKPSK